MCRAAEMFDLFSRLKLPFGVRWLCLSLSFDLRTSTKEESFNLGDKMDSISHPMFLLDSTSDTRSKGLIGTTIIAIAGKKGIFIAADGKTLENGVGRGQILQWDYPKIVSITDHVMATICASINESVWIIQKVIKAVEKLSKVPIDVVRKKFRRYLDKWKKKEENLNKEFRGVVLVYGYRNGKPVIYSVATDEYLESDTGVFGCGTGFEIAKEYVVARLKNHNGEPTSSDYIQWVSTAVAVAALFEPWSGGYVRMADVWKSKKKMKKRGGHFTRGDHVLQILERDFDDLQKYMERVFMVVTYRMEYTLFNESEIKRSFLDSDMGFDSAHLIAVGKCTDKYPDTVITRLKPFFFFCGGFAPNRIKDISLVKDEFNITKYSQPQD
ncbi:hypothetical protein ACLB2K_049979 [Fragaria x ananassa]